MGSDRHAHWRSVIERIGDDLPGSEFEYRRMFGAVGVYSRGRFFAVIGEEGLALKLAPGDRAALLALPGAREWSISRQYVVAPPDLATVAALRPWVERSAGYAQTLPLPKRRARR
ncbi:MAG: TfoX/Sxy family protein [Chloroflexota bacterium]|nr:TfoX/Sxy family protein [Anaerolineae bacterium]HMM28764.1 TfoX/Sxy family protein [Aggregatilineaceae bacterium]